MSSTKIQSSSGRDSVLWLVNIEFALVVFGWIYFSVYHVSLSGFGVVDLSEYLATSLVFCVFASASMFSFSFYGRVTELSALSLFVAACFIATIPMQSVLWIVAYLLVAIFFSTLAKDAFNKQFSTL